MANENDFSLSDITLPPEQTPIMPESQGSVTVTPMGEVSPEQSIIPQIIPEQGFRDTGMAYDTKPETFFNNVADSILEQGKSDFDNRPELSLAESMASLFEYTRPADTYDLEAQEAIADAAFKIRRAKNAPILTPEDVIKYSQEEGIAEPEIETDMPIEAKEKALAEYAQDTINSIKKNMPLNEFLEIKRELEFSFDKIQEGVLRQSEGEKAKEQSWFGEAKGRLTGGYTSLIGQQIESYLDKETGKRIQQYAYSMTDPSRDGNYVAELLEGLGQAGAQISELGVTALAGPVGAVIGTGALTADQINRDLKNVYNKAYEEYGDKEKALDVMVNKAPFSFIENTLDNVLQLKVVKYAGKIVPLFKVPKSLYPEIFKKSLLKEAAKSGAGEFAGAAIGQYGEERAFGFKQGWGNRTFRKASQEGLVGFIATGGVGTTQKVLSSDISKSILGSEAGKIGKDTDKILQESQKNAESLVNSVTSKSKEKSTGFFSRLLTNFSKLISSIKKEENLIEVEDPTPTKTTEFQKEASEPLIKEVIESDGDIETQVDAETTLQEINENNVDLKDVRNKVKEIETEYNKKIDEAKTNEEFQQLFEEKNSKINDAIKSKLGQPKENPEKLQKIQESIKNSESFKALDLENPDTFVPITTQKLAEQHNLSEEEKQIAYANALQPKSNQKANEQRVEKILKDIPLEKAIYNYLTPTSEIAPERLETGLKALQEDTIFRNIIAKQLINKLEKEMEKSSDPLKKIELNEKLHAILPTINATKEAQVLASMRFQYDHLISSLKDKTVFKKVLEQTVNESQNRLTPVTPEEAELVGSYAKESKDLEILEESIEKDQTLLEGAKYDVLQKQKALDDKENDLIESNKTIKTLEQEVKNLKESTTFESEQVEITPEINELQNKIKQLEAQIENSQLTEKQKDLIQKEKDLRTKIAKKNTKIKELSNKNLGTPDVLKTPEQLVAINQIEKTKQEQESLQNTLEQTKKQIEQDEVLKELQKVKEELNRAYNGLTSKIDNEIEKQKLANKPKAKILEARDDLDVKIKGLEGTIKTLINRKKDVLILEIETKTKLKNRLSAQISKLGGRNPTKLSLQAKIEKLEDAIKEKREFLKNEQKLIKENRQIRKIKERLIRLTKEKLSLEGKIKRAKVYKENFITRKQIKIDELNNTIRSLKKELPILKKDTEQLRKNLAESLQPLRKVSNRLKATKYRYENLEKITKKKKEKIEELIKYQKKELSYDALPPDVKKRVDNAFEKISKLSTPENDIKSKVITSKLMKEAVDIMALHYGLTPADLLTHYQYTGMLSSLSTAVRNFLFTGINTLVANPMYYLSHPTKIKPAIKGFPEAFRRAIMDIQAIKQGQISKVNALENNLSYNPVFTLLNTPNQYLSPKLRRAKKTLLYTTLGSAKFSFKLLAQADAFFNKMTEIPRLYAEANIRKARDIKPAYQQAVKEYQSLGITPTKLELNQRAYEILDDKISETEKETARNFSNTTTLTGKPTGLLGELSVFLNKAFTKLEFDPTIPVNLLLKPFDAIWRQVLGRTNKVQLPFKIGKYPLAKLYIMPFVNITANAANIGLEYIPGYGYIDLGKKFDSNYKPASDFKERTLKQLVGAGVAGAVYGLASAYIDDEDPAFAIYGSGDMLSKGQKETLRQSGWKPFSIRVLGRNWSFVNTPLVYVLAPLANHFDNLRWRDSKYDREAGIKKVGNIISANYKVFGELAFLENLSNFISADPKKAGGIKGFSEDFIKNFIPARGLLGSVEKIARASAAKLDMKTLDYMYEIEKDDSWGGLVLSHFPVASAWAGKPALNLFGEPIKADWGDVFGILKGVTSKPKVDPILKWVSDNNFKISMFGKENQYDEGGESFVAGFTKTDIYKQREQNLEENMTEYDRFWNSLPAENLTAEERYNYTKIAGPKIKEALQTAMTIIPFLPYSQEEKQKILTNKFITPAKQRAKMEFFSKYYPFIASPK